MQNEVFNAKLNKEVLQGDDISYLELSRNPNLTQDQRKRLRIARKQSFQIRKEINKS